MNSQVKMVKWHLAKAFTLVSPKSTYLHRGKDDNSTSTRIFPVSPSNSWRLKGAADHPGSKLKQSRTSAFPWVFSGKQRLKGKHLQHRSYVGFQHQSYRDKLCGNFGFSVGLINDRKLGPSMNHNGMGAAARDWEPPRSGVTGHQGNIWENDDSPVDRIGRRIFR